MPGETLATLIARLNRVNANIKAFDRRIQAFVDDANTYRVYPQQDPNTGQVIVFGQALADPPAAEWAPFISEIVGGIRTVLDNIVWGLGVKHQRRQGVRPPTGPLPSKSPWRESAFPVVTNAANWKSAINTALRLIDPALIDIIEKVQPFHTGKHRPEREPLAIVQELWKIDKHRHAPIVRAFVGGKDTYIRLHLPPEATFATYTVDSIGRRRVLRTQAPTELARLTVLGVNAPVGMDVEHQVPFEIALKRGYPGYGQPLDDTLKSARDAAHVLLTQLKSSLP